MGMSETGFQHQVVGLEQNVGLGYKLFEDESGKENKWRKRNICWYHVYYK